MDVAVLAQSSGMKNNYDANAILPGLTIIVGEPKIAAAPTTVAILVSEAFDIT